jgi:hypothetical protein
MVQCDFFLHVQYMKLFGYPKLGAQYTPYPINGKSSWSTRAAMPFTPTPTQKQSNFTTVVPGLSKVVCIAFDNNQNLYISCDGSPNQLLKYNSSFQKQPFVSDDAWVGGTVGTLPVAMAFNESYSALYVVNFASNNLTRINMSDFSYLQVNLTGQGGNSGVGYRLNAPNGLTFDATYSYLVATNVTDSNLVQIVLNGSGTSGVVGPFCPSAPFTQPVLVTNDANNNFYVSNLNTNQIFVVTSTTYSVLASLTLPRGVSFNTNNYNYLWATSSGSDTPVASINVSDPSSVQMYKDPLFNNPRGIVFDANNYMYVANFGSGGANTASILKSKQPVFI